MDKTSTLPEVNTPMRTSELDKFKLFYEASTTTQDERSRLKRATRKSNR